MPLSDLNIEGHFCAVWSLSNSHILVKHSTNFRRIYGNHMGRIFTAVCCFYFRTISEKPTQTWHSNVSPLVLETHLFWGQRSKVKVTGYKNMPAWVFALLWVLAASSFLPITLVVHVKQSVWCVCVYGCVSIRPITFERNDLDVDIWPVGSYWYNLGQV